MGARRLLLAILVIIGLALLAGAGLAVVDGVRDDGPHQAAQSARFPATDTQSPATRTADPISPGARPTAVPSDPTTAESTDEPTAASPDEQIVAGEEPADPQAFTVLVSGDVLLHENMWAQARKDAGGEGYDFRPMFGDVRPVISAADLAICHLETPVGPADGPFSGYPIFSVPPQIVSALAWAGYDACTTASNHTIDKGEEGVIRTLDALADAGLAHAGSARTPEEAARVTILEVGADAAEPTQVAVLSYTYGLNGLRPPEGKEWIVNLIDQDEILDDAALARMHGADVVLVGLHWGLEYQHEPTDDQRKLAKALLASADVDVVYGHHAHVVQPFEVLKDKWVAYGLGNHLAKQSSQRPRTHEGVMARFTFTADEADNWTATRAEYIPTRMPLRPPHHLVDLSSAGGASEAGQDAYKRIKDVVERLGAAHDGLRPAD